MPYCMKILTDVLPRLHNLSTFSYGDQKFGPTLELVSSLARSSSSLTTFELNTVFLSHNAVKSFTEFSGLYRLLVTQPEGVTLATAPETSRSLSLRCVVNLILACHETLDHIELPGEFFPFPAFLPGPSKLTVLRTLVLHGYPPLNADTPPLWKILPSFPRLSKLEVLFRLRIIGARPSRYTLIPSDTLEPPISPSSLLETLSIANPAMEDHIFLHLPPFLRSLTLDFVPEWENMLASRDSLAYHRPERMCWFLNKMKKQTRGQLPDLENFCIKMGWCATPELITCISQVFPNLTYLELQGIRYVDRTEEPDSDMTLKLAVELPEDPYEYSATAERAVGSVEQASSRWAEALANRLPSLRLLAFERRPHVGRALGPRVLLGRPVWVWFDIRNGVAERQLSLADGPSQWSMMRKRRVEAESRHKQLQDMVPEYNSI
ncbi:hypothetical protein DXG01_012359 [Tephrocybe rancida]|nr:hypothetical protein DXG01_012359 [Tephrocybe rancida]